MQAQTQWLSEEEKSLVCEEALGLLGDVGMKIEGSRSLDLLAEAGAHVDHDSSVVRFPSEMVLRAIKQCPRELLMAAATPDQDVLLRDGVPSHFCPGGCGSMTLDYRTGQRRESTLDDLREATALLDETPQIDVVWTTITPNDLPAEHRELAGYCAVLEETSKHIVLVDSPSRIEPLRELSEVLAGSADLFRERPRFTTLCTVAPGFRMHGPLLDFHAQVATLGAPVKVFSAPSMGATSPVTIAGTVTQVVAEVLGAVTALQTLAPGARLIMGIAPTVLDMRACRAAMAAPEAALAAAACVEVAHYLGLPAAVSGLATEAKHAGVQAGYEKMLKGLTVAQAGTDLISGGVGLIDSANTLYLPQIIIDAEIVALIETLLGDVEVSRQSILRESIERAGTVGSFLAERETRRRIRAGEHFLPLISNRRSYEAWHNAALTEVDVAVERLEGMLSQRRRRTSYLSGEQRSNLRRVCHMGAFAPRGASN